MAVSFATFINRENMADKGTQPLAVEDSMAGCSSLVSNAPLSKRRKSKRIAASIRKPEVMESDSEEDFNVLKVEYEVQRDFETGQMTIMIADIPWAQSNLDELIKRIEYGIPSNDNLAFSSRVDKLDWNEIAFQSYSSEQCKDAWFAMQKKIRRYRLLKEVLQDAKQLVSDSWPQFLNNNLLLNIPQQPLTASIIYFNKKKNKVIAENPGIEMDELSKRIDKMFENMSPIKRQKYLKLEAEELIKYNDLLKKYTNQAQASTSTGGNVSKEPIPKKPLSPFGMYFQEQLKMKPECEEHSLFRDYCKEQWKNLSDNKKIIWIDLALINETNYKQDLSRYKAQNPTFTIKPSKPILNKEEKLLKERLSGKPKKPPTSAYALFSQMMMQSNVMKTINTKQRLKSVAEQWKSCTEEERIKFKQHVDDLQLDYKQKYADYLNNLSEEQQPQATNTGSNKKKKLLKRNSSPVDTITPTKKIKIATITSTEENVPKPSENQENIPETNGESQRGKRKRNSKVSQNDNPPEEMPMILGNLMEVLQAEPPSPPISGFDLYKAHFDGRHPVENAWQRLTNQEKIAYEMEANEMKNEYIKEYEIFLKSLSKEQLTAFSVINKCLPKKPTSGNSSNNDND